MAASVIRLYVRDQLRPAETLVDEALTLDHAQSHFLVNVMRKGVGTPVHLFNGRDGEWRGQIIDADKKAVRIALLEQTRSQQPETDIWLCFAPLKKHRTDFVIEKATELGITRIRPVLTARTQTTRVNVDRLSVTAREAAEQSGGLSVPVISAPVTLSGLLADWPKDRTLIHLDETGTGTPLARVLVHNTGPVGFLVGPEGGFAPAEIDTLNNHSATIAADLGERILRAETASVAALAVHQAIDALTVDGLAMCPSD